MPVQSVQVFVNGQWVTLQRTSDNFFELNAGGPLAFPLQVRVTSVAGETFDDQISSLDSTISGGSQFASNPAYGTVGGPAPQGTARAPAVSASSPPAANATTPPAVNAIAPQGCAQPNLCSLPNAPTHSRYNQLMHQSTPLLNDQWAVSIARKNLYC